MADSDNGVQRGAVTLKPDGYSLRLTTLDLMAALIPGVVWLGVGAALWGLSHDGNAIAGVAGLFEKPFGVTGGPGVVITVLLSFVVGYALRAYVMSIATFLSADPFWAYLRCRMNRPENTASTQTTDPNSAQPAAPANTTRPPDTGTTCPSGISQDQATGSTARDSSSSLAPVVGTGIASSPPPMTNNSSLLRRLRSGWKKHRFPYNPQFAGPYFDEVKQALARELRLSHTDIMTLPRNPPFSECKRIVRVLQPGLWEELERREGETRLVAALFVATAVATIVGAAVIIMHGSVATLPSPLAWTLIGLSITVFLGGGFRLLRRKEIEYVYIAFLIATAPSRPSRQQASTCGLFIQD